MVDNSFDYVAREQSRPVAGGVLEVGLLCAVAIALLLPISKPYIDPLGIHVGLAENKYLRIAPLGTLLASLSLFVAISAILRRQLVPPGVTRIGFPLLLLTVWILAGGAYARLILNIENSFLIAGVSMLAMPLAACAVVWSANPGRMLRGIVTLFVVGSGLIVFNLIDAFNQRQVHHELEFLVIPLLLFFTIARLPIWTKLPAILVFSLAVLLFQKNTAYLIGLVIFLYLLFYFVRMAIFKGSFTTARNSVLFAALVLIVLTAVVAALIYFRKDYLPSGNVSVRLYYYELAFEAFLQAPIIGEAFLGPASREIFTVDIVGLRHDTLPTHSDILDILANGGIVGFVLWAWGYGRIFRLSTGTIWQPFFQTHPLSPYAHLFMAMSIAGLITYAFNPIFLQPGLAFLLWLVLGLLLGIALRVRGEIRRWHLLTAAQWADQSRISNSAYDAVFEVDRK